jgi:hypothetical protein
MRDSAAWNKTACRKSRGLSLIGLIMVLFILIVLALFGMKILPAYIEYGTAKKAIEAIARDRSGASTPQDARRLFDNRALIDNITVIKGSDLDITKDGSGLVIAFAYRKEMSLVANVGLYIDFAASSAGQ